MIRNFVKPAILSLAVLACAAPAFADYDAGMLAAKSGNQTEAYRQWELSAKLGEPRSQKALGQMLESGQGVLQDFVAAHMWLNLAASQGDKEAAKERDALSKRMSAEQIALAQSRAQAFKPGLPEDVAIRVDQATYSAAPQETVTSSPDRPAAKPDKKAEAAKPAPSPLAGLWFDAKNGFVMSIEPDDQGGFVMKEALVDDKYNYPGDVIGKFKPNGKGDGFAGSHLWGGNRTGDASWSDDGSLQVTLSNARRILVKYTDSKFADGWTYEKIK